MQILLRSEVDKCIFLQLIKIFEIIFHIYWKNEVLKIK